MVIFYQLDDVIVFWKHFLLFLTFNIKLLLRDSIFLFFRVAQKMPIVMLGAFNAVFVRQNNGFKRSFIVYVAWENEMVCIFLTELLNAQKCWIL